MLVDLCCQWASAHGLESAASRCPGNCGTDSIPFPSQASRAEVETCEAQLQSPQQRGCPRHASIVSEKSGVAPVRTVESPPPTSGVTHVSSARNRRQSWCSMSTRSECATIAAESARGTHSLLYHADSKDLSGPSTMRTSQRKCARKAGAKIWGLIGRSTEEDEDASGDDGADVKRWSRLSSARDSILMHKESAQASRDGAQSGMRSMGWLSTFGGLTAIGRNKDGKAKSHTCHVTQAEPPMPMHRGRTSKQSTRSWSLKTRSLTPELYRSSSWSSQYLVPGSVNEPTSRSSRSPSAGRSSARESSKGGSCRGSRHRRPPTPPRAQSPASQAERSTPTARVTRGPPPSPVVGLLSDEGVSTGYDGPGADKADEGAPVIEMIEDPVETPGTVATSERPGGSPTPSLWEAKSIAAEVWLPDSEIDGPAAGDTYVGARPGVAPYPSSCSSRSPRQAAPFSGRPAQPGATRSPSPRPRAASEKLCSPRGLLPPLGGLPAIRRAGSAEEP